MDDKEQIAAASIAPVSKRRRASAPRKAKKPVGRKTLIAAVAALVVSLVDLFLLIRLGISPW